MTSTQNSPAYVSDLPLNDSDFSALWAAVKANPDDSAPALVAADWCQERGMESLAAGLKMLGGGCKIGNVSVVIHMVKPNSPARSPYPSITGLTDNNRIAKDFNFRFYTLERAVQYAASKVAEKLVRQSARDDKKERLAAHKATWKNPYQVGQLLYHSWGYDETHYDFAQIVSVGPRSVTVRRISARHIESKGWCQEVVGPDRDGFLEDSKPSTISIQFSEYSGTIEHRIPGWSECGERETYTSTAGSR